MTPTLILGITNLIVGILIFLVSLPLVFRKIPMNPVYGVRFKKSFESQENWYKINAYGGKRLMVWSLLLIGLGLACFFLPPGENPVWLTLIGCAPLILVIPAIQSYFFARRL